MPPKTQDLSRLRSALGCTGCSVLLLGLLILAFWLIFARGCSRSSSSSTDGSGQTTAPVKIDPAFGGQHASIERNTRYDLDIAARRFLFYVPVESKLRLQTEISPCQFLANDSGSVIEVFGTDHQAGGAPLTRFKITRITGSSFHLERLKPVGGDLGLFQ